MKSESFLVFSYLPVGPMKVSSIYTVQNPAELKISVFFLVFLRFRFIQTRKNEEKHRKFLTQRDFGQYFIHISHSHKIGNSPKYIYYPKFRTSLNFHVFSSFFSFSFYSNSKNSKKKHGN